MTAYTSLRGALAVSFLLFFLCSGFPARSLAAVGGDPGTERPALAPGGDEKADALVWKGYGAAVRDAKKSGRKILVDVYTVWCGWCKRMDRDVYARADVIRILSSSFELVKLNAESSAQHEVDGVAYSEKEIASGYGVTGYPTTIFLNADAEGITVLPGYIKPDQFLAVLEYIGKELYKTTSWDAFLKSKSSD